MKEIIEARIESSGINHHHQRVYEHDCSFYMLDKTMDSIPPFYKFHALHFDPRNTYGQPTTIKVYDKEYWGNGYTWKQAEAIIYNIIVNDGSILI
jgi:hypothetical protein